jgi:transposase
MKWEICGGPVFGVHITGMYSIMQTCKLQGVEPWAYLYDVISKAPYLREDELAQLTPRLWKQVRDRA